MRKKRTEVRWKPNPMSWLCWLMAMSDKHDQPTSTVSRHARDSGSQPHTCLISEKEEEQVEEEEQEKV